MQKMLTLLLVLAASSAVQAQSRDVQAYCAAIGGLARAIMQNRQAGASMAEMMAAEAPSPAFQELGQTLIAAAFREPLADTGEAKQRAVNAFENSTTAACTATGEGAD